MNSPLVSIKTITYNHRPYIKDCIEGVLMQKTNFSFEYIIGDDCSTDGTADIVNEYAQRYPHIIKLVSPENNVGAWENDRRTTNACTGKYVAICEGDDFWTDTRKLQKQIDFLEANPDYGMVHCDFSNKIGRILVRNVWKNRQIPQGDVFQELVLENFVVTATVCMRNDLLQEICIYSADKTKKWIMGDYPLWLEIASKMKIGFITDDMATYRVHSNSVSHNLDLEGSYKFFTDRYDIKRYFANQYGAKHLNPIIEDNYHKELLKFSIFMKNCNLRRQCIKHYSNNGKKRFFLWSLFAKYSILDPLFNLLYFLKQKFKLRESL